MTSAETLTAGGRTLTRASAADRTEIETLQRAAYARNRSLLGVEPLPLLADYDLICKTHEVWLTHTDDRISGVLILEERPGDLLIWSVAADPAYQGHGLGRAMLTAAETRARQLGRQVLRLYTGAPLQHLIDWYGRHGFVTERLERLSDRSIVHMVKSLA
ncbi:MAG: GNAT family N-acetyltransferase [Hyphomicrobiaceae bacterium]